MTNSKQEVMELLTQPERRRRWSVEENLAMVQENHEPGKTVSMAARRRGVNPNQLFHWRKLYQDGGLSAVEAGGQVIPASEPADAFKQILELQRMVGKKTMENEILREVVEYDRSKKWIARSPSLPGEVHSRGGPLTRVCGVLSVARPNMAVRLARSPEKPDIDPVFRMRFTDDFQPASSIRNSGQRGNQR